MTYTPPHMIERMDHVRAVWIAEYEAKKQGKFQALIPTIISYSIGYWSGSYGRGATFWLTTVLISIVIWYGFRWLKKIYKINL